MTEENQAKLRELRTKVLDDIIPLMEEDVFEPIQKFILLLSSARASGESKVLLAAYKAATSIEDTAQKADALLELLEEIDVQLGDITFDDEPAIEAQAGQEQSVSQKTEAPTAEVQAAE